VGVHCGHTNRTSASRRNREKQFPLSRPAAVRIRRERKAQHLVRYDKRCYVAFGERRAGSGALQYAAAVQRHVATARTRRRLSGFVA
jgi:hypothetical protein